MTDKNVNASSLKSTVNASVSKQRSKHTANMSRMNVSRSRRHGGGAGGTTDNSSQPIVVVVDGIDVTPKSLVMGGQPRVSGGTQKNLAGSGSTTPTQSDSVDLDRMSSAFGRSGLSSSQSGAASDESGSSDIDLSDQEFVPLPVAPVQVLADAKDEPPKVWTQEELDEQMTIRLSETPTTTLLHIKGLCISSEHPLHGKVAEKNKRYDDFMQSRVGSDLFVVSSAQTLNNSQKAKEVVAAPPPIRDMGCMATQWDIHDTFLSDPVPSHEEIQLQCQREVQHAVSQSLKSPGCLLNLEVTAPTPVDGSVKSFKERDINATGGKRRAGDDDSSVSASTSTYNKSTISGKNPAGGNSFKSIDRRLSSSHLNHTASTTDVTSSTAGGRSTGGAASVEPGMEQPAVPEEPPLSEEVVPSLRVLEKMLAQNCFHDQHLLYRDYPAHIASSLYSHTADDEVAESEAAESGQGEEEASLLKLFQFSCALTEGRNVSSADWNKVNQDLLAVSYGEFDYSAQKEGYIMFWSLKNPLWPERVIKTAAGVTSLHWSAGQPNLLASGSYDGVVAIWDVRKPGDKPVLESTTKKHQDTVWEVQWVDRGAEKGEALVSISSDGHIYEWSMKKGLEQQQLMQLKRMHNPVSQPSSSASNASSVDAMLQQSASGLCIDFLKSDSSTYLSGTEDGLIHRCSISYNTQCLDTYIGHSGPVYKLRCSPFWDSVFASCSADWSIKLWNIREDKTLLTCQSTDLTDQVNDVVWSPKVSTIFGSVCDDGRIEIWDIAKSTLDPIIRFNEAEADKKRTVIRFANNSPVVVTGDNTGVVDVFRLCGLEECPYSQQEQVERLRHAVYSEQQEQQKINQSHHQKRH